MEYIKDFIGQSDNYTIDLLKGTCTCKGFKFGNGKLYANKTCCKHLDEALKTLSNEELLLLHQNRSKVAKYYLSSIETITGKVRIPLPKAIDMINRRIDPIMSDLFISESVNRYSYLGSQRRKMDGDIDPLSTIGDVDLLYSGQISIDEICNKIKPERYKNKGNIHRMVEIEGIHTDITVCTDDEYAFHQLWGTGSANHNKILCNIAISKGLRLSQHGLFVRNTDTKVAGSFTCEKDIFDYLGVVYVSPRYR